jgi:hypothetical protein
MYPHTCTYWQIKNNYSGPDDACFHLFDKMITDFVYTIYSKIFILCTDKSLAKRL